MPKDPAVTIQSYDEFPKRVRVVGGFDVSVPLTPNAERPTLARLEVTIAAAIRRAIRERVKRA